jgi:hypothetical protein
MAIDVDALNIGMPDQITFKLTCRAIQREMKLPFEKWTYMTDTERHRAIVDWATEVMLSAATVTASVGHAPKSEPYGKPRPIKDNPQA